MKNVECIYVILEDKSEGNGNKGRQKKDEAVLKKKEKYVTRCGERGRLGCEPSKFVQRPT
jgi:hypothetical protein